MSLKFVFKLVTLNRFNVKKRKNKCMYRYMYIHLMLKACEGKKERKSKRKKKEFGKGWQSKVTKKPLCPLRVGMKRRHHPLGE